MGKTMKIKEDGVYSESKRINEPSELDMKTKKEEKKKKKEKKEKKEKKRKRQESTSNDNDSDNDNDKHDKSSNLEHKKRQRQEHEHDIEGEKSILVRDDDDDQTNKEKKQKKEDKKVKKRDRNGAHATEGDIHGRDIHKSSSATHSSSMSSTSDVLSFPYKYILAPMVGASELPFRLLCRKYGAQLAYTPMMSAAQFGTDPDYRRREFQTTMEDRPLVCHFAANDPIDFAKAALAAAPYCDAIDLNLGCPQRTAFVGHFGSYLLTPKDRTLLLDIVKAGVKAVSIPIFVKIRLLDTVDETLELVRELANAGARLIAIHARYRASFERKGPGARDGPAMLDQVATIRQVIQTDKTLKHVLIVTNGNTITYDDVVKNLDSTRADGIMSAEGILDNPALFLGRWGSRDEVDKPVKVLYPPIASGPTTNGQGETSQNDTLLKKKRKLVKKMREIERIESKLLAKAGDDESSSLTKDQRDKLATKAEIQKSLDTLEAELAALEANGATSKASTGNTDKDSHGEKSSTPTMLTTTLGALYQSSDDKIALALEYVRLVRQFPASMRTVIFHTRRMIKTELTTFQLMDDCLTCTTIDAMAGLLEKLCAYQAHPETFQFDVKKAQLEKEALERKRLEEGKRKAYEARMIRKAKREGKTGADLEYYLRQGATVPTLEVIKKLHALSSKEYQIALWKEQDHSQHCLAFHLTSGNCPRARACAFLHIDPQSKTSFVEQDEVAG